MPAPKKHVRALQTIPHHSKATGQENYKETKKISKLLAPKSCQWNIDNPKKKTRTIFLQFLSSSYFPPHTTNTFGYDTKQFCPMIHFLGHKKIHLSRHFWQWLEFITTITLWGNSQPEKTNSLQEEWQIWRRRISKLLKLW